MEPSRDRTRVPWNCSQTRIFSQTRYRLRYAARRREMIQGMSPLCEPKLDTPLYGKKELSNESNKHIFISVQEYLIKTKSFK